MTATERTCQSDRHVELVVVIDKFSASKGSKKVTARRVEQVTAIQMSLQ